MAATNWEPFGERQKEIKIVSKEWLQTQPFSGAALMRGLEARFVLLRVRWLELPDGEVTMQDGCEREEDRRLQMRKSVWPGSIVERKFFAFLRVSKRMDNICNSNKV
ncbi:hypothetical protein CEXT_217051 [Caerostris extrusa]|uniref:Uncharacterized protein n=1 Tax=Caerostris extrusa TaxID=172846 RepID=A0AAV4N5G7_CAEEX|nr:hypothetical protein CEXT_217051 [Caerostris extrusa]